MNNLIVKEVNFNDKPIVAIQNENQKIFAGINFILSGMGFSERQIEYQRSKWLNDKAICKGVQKFSYPSENGGIQETYCIDIKRLPLALAKINITPKMLKENEELSSSLEVYQDKCADVLEKAFVQKMQFPIPQTLSEALRLAADLAEENEILKPKAESYDVFLTGQNYQTWNDVAKSLKIGRNKMLKFLRDKDILMHNNIPYQRYIEQKLFTVREVNILRGNYSFNGNQTLVSAKGIVFIEKLLKNEKGLLCQANQFQQIS